MLLAAVLATLLTQTPQPQQGATGTIEGQVLKAGTADPIAGVTIELIPAGLQVIVAAAFKTGADGKFRLQDIPPGEYHLYGTHSNGWTPAEYGQRSPTGLGMPLVLAAGQAKTGIVLKMERTASISGRVTDGNREPAAFSSMLAFRIVYRQGVRTVEVVQSVLTDDRGEYRYHASRKHARSLRKIREHAACIRRSSERLRNRTWCTRGPD